MSLSIDWIIKNCLKDFSSKNNRKEIKNIDIPIGKKVTKWAVKLIFNKNKNAVELYLFKKKVPRDNLIVNFSVLINKSEFQWCKKSAEIGGSWGWPCLIRLEDLFNREKEYIDSMGRLKLHIEIELTEIDASLDLNASTAASQCDKSCETCAYYYNNNAYTDFTLICADGEAIPVHRVFLAKKSPVFKKMFEQDEKSATLEIQSETMKEVLRFIYCGTSDLFENVKLITNVLRAAEKYEISELITKCIEALMEQINKENAVEILDIAVLHCQEELEKKCLCMILKNYNELKDTEMWSELKFPLIMKIMDAAINSSAQLSSHNIS